MLEAKQLRPRAKSSGQAAAKREILQKMPATAPQFNPKGKKVGTSQGKRSHKPGVRQLGLSNLRGRVIILLSSARMRRAGATLGGDYLFVVWALASCKEVSPGFIRRAVQGNPESTYL